ncbi:MAG: precorrin-2 C(20)-methyltransferase [Armatimonadota bacterium]
MTGMIYGIGVGPGDPQLLTVKAVQTLQEVDAVLVPRSRGDRDSLALSIAQPHLRASCDILDAVFPMTEQREVLQRAWEEAAALLLARADAGQRVAFLTLGDAMLYSTWSYLLATLRRLRPEINTVTIPGITAMSACAAALGSPLAEGRSPLLVWPDAPPADLSSLLEIAPNIVFMKSARHLEKLAEMAEVHSLDAEAVRRCSLPEEERTRDLREWVGEGEYFTTVLMRAKEQA